MGMLWSGARVQPLPFMLLPCLADAYPRGGPSGFAAANALHRACVKCGGSRAGLGGLFMRTYVRTACCRPLANCPD